MDSIGMDSIGMDSIGMDSIGMDSIGMDSAPIHLGTSSWQFNAWKGVFYPESLAAKGFLGFYATQFDTVEVNTSFYALPRAAVIVDWALAAPPGFTYALKTPRAISHEKKLIDAEAEMAAYLDTLRALGVAAAPGFLQLPPAFTRRTHGRTLAAFLDWLAPRLDGLRLAVEVRAADLMTPAFARFLAERGLAPAIVERQGQPDLWPLQHALLEEGLAPRFAFLRWIGDDTHGPQGDRELSAPRDEALALWAERLQMLAAAGIECFGYMHNPYEGHAPASVRRLRALLGDAAPPPAGQLSLL